MVTSPKWASLCGEIEALKGYFLPAQFDPLGIYFNNDLVQAQTRAFLVLSHAEIESYLEEWAKDIARTAEKLWREHNKVSIPLASLVATIGERVSIPPKLSNPAASRHPLDRITTSLFQKYYERIKDNNGIKEANVLSLFYPIGVPESAFESTLLASLDSFGAIRGSHAHLSARAVVSPLDPETEYNRVRNLLRDLEEMDKSLGSYLTQIQ